MAVGGRWRTSALRLLIKLSFRTFVTFGRFVSSAAGQQLVWKGRPMTLPTSAFEPTSNDFRLIEEAVRRVRRASPIPGHHDGKLQAALVGELGRGRRDLFSLVRAGRRLIEQS